MICVSIGRTRHKMVVLEYRALADKGAELVELRLDWIARQPDLPRLLTDRPTPCVVTCRRQTDRGRWKWGEEQRRALLRAAIVAEVEYVDLEDDVAGDIPRYGTTKRIVSHHNFEQTPDDLGAIHARLCKLDPDVIKLVTMANAPSDIVRMLQLVQGADVPTIGFCMGELGMPSRVLCGKYGAPFTYASFSKERELAPGQIAFSEMRHLYRYDAINAQTQVFGVLGDPIAQSHSPLVHNAAYRKAGMNCVYLPFRVPRDSLEQTLRDFQWLNLQGYSVTIPHKAAVVEWADVSSAIVREVGAANTLYWRDGVWHAENTDYAAALQCIREGLASDPHLGDDLAGLKVVLLGAGGVARAVAHGLLRADCDVTIANRHHARAKQLAAELGCKAVKWENRASELADALVNCTPVGMYPDRIDETPFPMNWIRDGMLVFDTVYNPENTLLLKEARERDCLTVSGLEMFVRQAAAQFEFFTGKPAPVEFMREALRRGISAVNY
ncbi:MAG: shikimate dehydrogenase [Planctomycetaceae bacterium]